MSKRIHEWSVSYQICRYYVQFVYRLFFKKITVKGLENIPKQQPVIFAINHQNAIMDALAVVCTVPSQPVFMVRADVFQSKMVSKILHWLKTMPIYRQRDGTSQLQKNDQVFNTVYEALKENSAVALMPEGTHLGKYQLQPLLKGIFRFAFAFQEKFPESKAPLIVPVGLHYSNYYTFRNKLFVQYGKPIHTNEYFLHYQTNQARAILELKKHLEIEMKNLIINIDCGPEYGSVNFLREALRPQFIEVFKIQQKDAWREFPVDKKITEFCNGLFISDQKKFAELVELAHKLEAKLKSSKLPLQFLQLQNYNKIKLFASFVLFALLSMFAIPGFLISWPFRSIANKLNKNMEDKQFHSTTKYAILFLAIPIITLLIFLVCSLLHFTFSIKLLILLCTFISMELNQWHNRMLQHLNDILTVRSKKDDVILANEWVKKILEIFQNTN